MPSTMVTRSYVDHTSFPFAGAAMPDYYRARQMHRRRGPIPVMELIEYVDWFVDRESIQVEPRCEAVEVHRRGGGIDVALRDGRRIAARGFVLATGLSRRAAVPAAWVTLSGDNGHCRHASDLSDYGRFYDGGAEVLVIGGGQSGCEAAAAALAAGCRVTHVCRTPPRVVRESIESAIYHLHERFFTTIMNLLYRGDEVGLLRPMQRRVYDWLLGASVAETTAESLRGPMYHRVTGTAEPLAGGGHPLRVRINGDARSFHRAVLATGYRGDPRRDKLVDALCQRGFVALDERESYLLTDECFRSLADRRVVVTGQWAAPSQGPTCAFVAGLRKFRDCFERCLRNSSVN
jgi:cation diffusion facilitator CzcD-associated flavoprotein CzcO